MKVPPSESEKIACPMAATITFALRSDQRTLRMYHSTPFMAPGNVSERAMSTMMTTSSAGTMTLLAFSMPDRSPRCTTTAHATITAPVHIIWSRNDFRTNPASGGRIAAASKPGTIASATCPTA